MYNELNSVTLDAGLHNLFHQIYGYKQPVTINCFILFLNDLLTDTGFRNQVFALIQRRSGSELQKISHRPSGRKRL